MTALKWLAKGVVGILSALLLLQIEVGFYGWLMNFAIIVGVLCAAFAAGWLDYE